MTAREFVLGLILAGVLTLHFASTCGDASVEELRAAVADSIAAVHQSAADSLRAESDVLARANAELRAAYSADSLRWAASAAESRVRIERAARRASDVATDLTARLDSVGEALFREYEAERDSIETAYRVQVADLESERAALWVQRDTLTAEVDVLRQTLAAKDAETVALRQSNEALRDALTKRGRESRLLKIGGALVIGWAAYERLAG